MGYWIIDGKQMTNAEYEEHKRQEQETRERVRREAEALMRVQKALIDDTITAKKAGLLLYSLQLAVTNIGQTTFGEAEERELVTDLVDEEEAISGQNPTPSTTEDTERHREGRGLPLMNTDDTDRRGLLKTNAEEDGLEEELENVVAMRR